MPFKVVGSDLWRQGHLPLWTSLAGLGYPLLADGQAGLLYPPDVTLFLLFPPSTAFDLSVVAHALLGSGLAYAFFRRQGLTAPAAFLGSAVFTFAGPLLPLAGTPRMTVAAWWPGLLLAIDGLAFAATRGRDMIPPARWTIAGALIVAMMLLAGFPQVAAFGFALGAAYALYRARRSPLALVWMAAIFALGAGLAAPQWLSTLELAGQSSRAGGAGVLARPGSLFPPAALELVAPSFRDLATLGDESPNLSVGIIALALAAVPIYIGRRGGRFWAGVALVALVLAAGRFTPFFWLTTHAPGFAYFRVPARFLYLTTTALAALAALGLDGLLRRPRAKSLGRPVLLSGLVLGGCGGATILGTGLAIRLAQDRLYAIVARLPGIGTTTGEAATSRLAAAALMATDVKNLQVWLPIVGTLGIVLVVLTLRYRSRRYLVGVAIGFSLLELVTPRYPIDKVGSFLPTTAIADLTRAVSCPGPMCNDSASVGAPSFTRIYSLAAPYTAATDGRYDLLPPNLSALHGVASVGLYAALGDPTYANLLDPLGTVDLAFGDHHASAAAVAAHRALLDFLGARVIVSPEPLPGFGVQTQAGSVYVYQNADAFPRAWVATDVETVQGDLRSALESTDLRRMALVDGTEAVPRVDSANQPSSAMLLQDTGSRVVIGATGPGILVLDDRWAPGWTATIDGAPASVLRIDGILRGVALAPGDHQVVFTYRAPGFWSGVLLAMIALIGLIGLTMVAPSIPRPLSPTQGRKGRSP